MGLEDKVIFVFVALIVWAFLGVFVLNPILWDANFSGYNWFGEFLLGNYWVDIPLGIFLKLLRE